MRVISGVLLFVWFILKFVLHKGGFIHILLVAAISIAVVQLIAYRKTRYHTSSPKR